MKRSDITFDFLLKALRLFVKNHTRWLEADPIPYRFPWLNHECLLIPHCPYLTNPTLMSELTLVFNVSVVQEGLVITSLRNIIYL